MRLPWNSGVKYAQMVAMAPGGQWLTVRNGFLLPARVVMAVFRGKMLTAIRQALAREELTVPEPMRLQQLLNLLNRLGHPTKTPWNVRIMERYPHGAGVVTYLARYLRGGSIKNARLVAWEGTVSPSRIGRALRRMGLGPLRGRA